jgi:hypothetical protein
VGRLEGLHLEEDHEKKYGKGSALNMKEPRLSKESGFVGRERTADTKLGKAVKGYAWKGVLRSPSS